MKKAFDLYKSYFPNLTSKRCTKKLHLKHINIREVLFALFFFATILTALYTSGLLYDDELDSLDEYGLLVCCFLYPLKLVVLLALLPNLFILYGTLFYNKAAQIQFCLPKKMHMLSFRDTRRFSDSSQRECQ